MNMLQTVEFDIALTRQLRSQNVSLEAGAISGIRRLTWNIIKVVANYLESAKIGQKSPFGNSPSRRNQRYYIEPVYAENPTMDKASTRKKLIIKSEQVTSKRRVVDYAEVLTGEREVNAMLDLVKPETERIESRFLEPACGDGNFLTEILMRKLNLVESRYKKNQLEYERNAVLAISSIYGIDILPDNVTKCRIRLFDIFDEAYTRTYRKTAKKECSTSVRFILEKNIVWGDALTMKTVGDKPRPIVFAEWSLVKGSMLKRCDFMMSFLVEREDYR